MFKTDVSQCIAAIQMDKFSDSFRTSNYSTNVVLSSVLCALAIQCGIKVNAKEKKNDVDFDEEEKRMDPHSWRFQNKIYGKAFASPPPPLPISKKKSEELISLTENESAKVLIQLTNLLSEQYFEFVVREDKRIVDFKNTLVKKYVDTQWNSKCVFEKDMLNEKQSRKIYLLTHVLFFLTEYGTQPYKSEWATQKVFLEWMRQFNTVPKMKKNAEELYEIIACIFIQHTAFTPSELAEVMEKVYALQSLKLQQQSETQKATDPHLYYLFHCSYIDTEFESFHHNATAGIMFALAHLYHKQSQSSSVPAEVSQHVELKELAPGRPNKRKASEIASQSILQQSKSKKTQSSRRGSRSRSSTGAKTKLRPSMAAPEPLSKTMRRSDRLRKT